VKSILDSACAAVYEWSDGSQVRKVGEFWLAIKVDGAYLTLHGSTMAGQTPESLHNACRFETASLAAAELRRRGLGPAREEMTTEPASAGA
jgi:hypothetical protein